jgi:hypothetical protein
MKQKILFFILLCNAYILSAQKNVQYESRLSINDAGKNPTDNKYYATGELYLYKNNTYFYFIQSLSPTISLGNYPTRSCFSVGNYYYMNKSIYLKDTISNLTYIFKIQKDSSLINVKGVNIMKYMKLFKVNEKYELTPYEDMFYRIGIYRHYFKLNENYKKLNKQIDSSIFVYIDKSNLPGVYRCPILVFEYLLIIDKNGQFKILYYNLPLSSGKWKYNSGAIEFFDSHFKQSFYGYLIKDGSIYFIDFPLIYNSFFNQDYLEKIK